MPPRLRPIRVALLAVPEVTSSTLYGFHDTLLAVHRDWRMLHGAEPGESPFRTEVLSLDGRPFRAANGVRIHPDGAMSDAPVPDVVCITDIAVPPGHVLDTAYRPAVDWIRHCHDSGAMVACACSGAVLLAETGLLEDQDATSHWAYCDWLSRRYPGTRWHPERGLLVAGPDRRILMSGSGVAWHMLVLALIARYAGPEAAMQVARINLLDMHAASPVAYASLTRGGRAADPLVARCQAWAAEHYPEDAPVTRMVALSGLPERTFKRRFRAATGMGPLEYVHMLRLEEAKQLLETSDLPVDEIAAQVGYRDPGFFSRLFRRQVSLSPAQYRRRFGALSRQLQQVTGAG
ncbi:GlxA family transcriptional regulator [Arenimonas fontis]|uniref:Helix-turn-helix domain-containing protein n=1 Tax=Arenimonas fontis TaxID=2608255 RepID=A0A5B2ZCN7_9GAMM|nr:helix-turn-helix domain-containing protein [Arenimonas fontis]KAA2284892.1 helix-turn-helix domain-containing protein [Arenimonas fontis]